MPDRPSDRVDKIFDLPEIPKRNERLEILLSERPDPKAEGENSGKTFVLVSGLPRSGTSLMMQLLEAGGLPAMTDAERAADIDNPRGYFEWEAIKRIGKKPELLDDPAVEGNAIKCISMLPPHLPPQHQYKVIFMTRPIEEVIDSQETMTTRLGTKSAELDPRANRARIARASRETRGNAWPLPRRTSSCSRSLIRRSSGSRRSNCQTSPNFLGRSFCRTEPQWRRGIDPALYRRKA